MNSLKSLCLSPCAPYRCWSPHRCKRLHRSPQCRGSCIHAAPAALWLSGSWWQAWFPGGSTKEGKYETMNFWSDKDKCIRCSYTIHCLPLKVTHFQRRCFAQLTHYHWHHLQFHSYLLKIGFTTTKKTSYYTAWKLTSLSLFLLQWLDAKPVIYHLIPCSSCIVLITTYGQHSGN